MTALCVVQARMRSSRLPGKVLMDIGGRPALALQLARLRRGGFDVMVATSVAGADDPIEELVRTLDVPLLRGPEADVLERFRRAAVEQGSADPIVRLTGDCPLTDPEVVAHVLAVHDTSAADYTSNSLVRTYPDGFDVEVISRPALLAAADQAMRPDEREHVTPFLLRHPERFRLAAAVSAADLGDLRLTLDTEADLAVLRNVVQAVVDPMTAGWLELARRAPAAQPRTIRPVAADGPLLVRRFRAADTEVPGEVVVDLHGTVRCPPTIASLGPDQVLDDLRWWLAQDLQLADRDLTLRVSA